MQNICSANMCWIHMRNIVCKEGGFFLTVSKCHFIKYLYNGAIILPQNVSIIHVVLRYEGYTFRKLHVRQLIFFLHFYSSIFVKYLCAVGNTFPECLLKFNLLLNKNLCNADD